MSHFESVKLLFEWQTLSFVFWKFLLLCVDLKHKFFKTSSLLMIVVVIAVMVRVGASIYLGEELVGIQQRRIQDQVSYNALAISILKGQGYTFDRIWYPFTPANTPTAHWSFIYPLFLALTYSIFGFHPLIARLIQAVISGVIATILLYLLGIRRKLQ